MERAWPKLKEMNANARGVPGLLDEIEREQGKFDFRDFDQILRRARAQGSASSSSGSAPGKKRRHGLGAQLGQVRLSRVSPRPGFGRQTHSCASPHSRANLEADKAAYVAMVTHLRQVDEADRTVILMQVENESGLLGSIRDYSAEANKLFNGPVPAALVAALKKQPGTWTEVFGTGWRKRLSPPTTSPPTLTKSPRPEAGLSAAHLRQCLARRRRTPPTRLTPSTARARATPAAGRYPKCLDLWKANAPDIDVLSADTSVQPLVNFRMINARYVRPDNPYWSPEAGRTMSGARTFFYRAGGVFDPGLRRLRSGFRPRFRVGGPLYGLGRGTTAWSVPPCPSSSTWKPRESYKAAIADDVIRGKNLIFRPLPPAGSFRRRAGCGFTAAHALRPRAGGRVGANEFLIMGFNAAADFRPTVGSGFTAAQFLQVEEGIYDNGVWKTTNVGRTYQGTTPRPASLSRRRLHLRVKLMRY